MYSWKPGSLTAALKASSSVVVWNPAGKGASFWQGLAAVKLTVPARSCKRVADFILSKVIKKNLLGLAARRRRRTRNLASCR